MMPVVEILLFRKGVTGDFFSRNGGQSRQVCLNLKRD